MIGNALIAGVIAGVAYLLGMSPQICIAIWGVCFLLFAYNLARAEIEELKLILDEDAPGWRERNASWTSTWDWNRVLKRHLRRDRKRGKSLAESTETLLRHRSNGRENQ